jgi:hypothetical protein
MYESGLVTSNLTILNNKSGKFILRACRIHALFMLFLSIVCLFSYVYDAAAAYFHKLLEFDFWHLWMSWEFPIQPFPDAEAHIGLHVKCPSLSSKPVIGMCTQTSVQLSNIQSNENYSSRSRVVSSVQTDRRCDFITHFEGVKMCKKMTLRADLYTTLEMYCKVYIS